MLHSLLPADQLRSFIFYSTILPILFVLVIAFQFGRFILNRVWADGIFMFNLPESRLGADSVQPTWTISRSSFASAVVPATLCLAVGLNFDSAYRERNTSDAAVTLNPCARPATKTLASLVILLALNLYILMQSGMFTLSMTLYAALWHLATGTHWRYHPAHWSRSMNTGSPSSGNYIAKTTAGQVDPLTPEDSWIQLVRQLDDAPRAMSRQDKLRRLRLLRKEIVLLEESLVEGEREGRRVDANVGTVCGADTCCGRGGRVRSDGEALRRTGGGSGGYGGTMSGVGGGMGGTSNFIPGLRS